MLQRDDIVKLGDALLQTGIQSVRGKIVIDATYLDRVPEGPGWMWDDRPLIISALSIREIEPDTNTWNRAYACGHLLKTALMERGVSVAGRWSLEPYPQMQKLSLNIYHPHSLIFSN